MKNNDKNYIVYLHTVLQKTSGYKYKKYYVGITNNIEKRWESKGKKYKGQVFYNAIQKYGWDNIKHTILYKNLTKEKAMQKEKEMIIKYHSKVGDKGYNVSDGGEYIIEKRRNAYNIFCITTKEFFHSSAIAEKYLKESKYTITSKCNYHKNGNYTVKKGYKYCYADEAYLYIDNMKKGTSLIVDMNKKKCFPRPFIENLKEKRIRITTIDKYINVLDRNMFDNCERYMLLNDYLYLFDSIKLPI